MNDDEDPSDKDCSAEAEPCPICDRRNRVGEGDTCAHFFGAVCDGDLIWGQFEAPAGDDFRSAWAETLDRWDQAKAEQRRAAAPILESIQLNRRLLDRQASESEVLETWGNFETGPTIANEGMMSGEGHSLYHSDPQALISLTARLRLVCAALRP